MLGGGSDPPSGWSVHARGCRQHVLSFNPPPGSDVCLSRDGAPQVVSAPLPPKQRPRPAFPAPPPPLP